MTNLDEKNEPIVFTNNILGNYSSESFLGNFPVLKSPFPVDSVLSQLENFSQIDSSKCINIVHNIINKSYELFWRLYFDG